MAAQHSCKDCGVVFDTGKSLDVHLHYHKENLMTKWGQQQVQGGGQPGGGEDNNNVKKSRAVAAADSSDPGYPNYFQHQQQLQVVHHHHQQVQQQQVVAAAAAVGEYAENGGSAFQRLPRGGYRYQPYQQQPQEHHYFPQQQPAPQVYEEPQAEILDLDSHKVHVYQPPEGEDNNPWAFPYFEPDKKFLPEDSDSSPDPGGAVSTTGLEAGYYEPPPPPSRPAPAWKSNEARRPKTYNCSACNKWFTSSGHLKRHYNTTLHKNAVKQSGGADPANLPVSAHHHPPKAEPPLYPPEPPHEYLHHHQQSQQPAALYPPYPNALPPHVSSFGNDEPLPSFAQFQQNGFAEFAGGRDVGGPAEVSSSVSPPLHRCLDCDKTFNKACYLTQHNKSFHSGDKPYKCLRCGKRFPQEYLHLEHLSKHAGEKPYKCEMCPKQFNHKTDLRRHMCLHSGDKPYACELCGKGFIRKDHMLKHCETHKKRGKLHLL